MKVAQAPSRVQLTKIRRQRTLTWVDSGLFARQRQRHRVGAAGGGQRPQTRPVCHEPGWYSAAKVVSDQPLFRNALLRTLDMDTKQHDSIALVQCYSSLLDNEHCRRQPNPMSAMVRWRRLITHRGVAISHAV